VILSILPDFFIGVFPDVYIVVIDKAVTGSAVDRVAVFCGMNVESALDDMVAVQIVEVGIIIALSGAATPQTDKSRLIAPLIGNFIPVLIFSPLLVALGVEPGMTFQPVVSFQRGFPFQ